MPFLDQEITSLFKLNYLTEASVVLEGEQTEITIVGPANDYVRHDEIVDLSMTYVLSPGAIPLWALPTETITWTDHDGVVLGTGNSVSYLPAVDGYQSVEARVVLEDADNISEEVYRYEFSQDYSYTTEVLQQKDFIFTFEYTSDSGMLRYANMDITRSLSYFPKWSSANSNHYSNISKFLSPQLERVSFHTNDLDDIFANNNTLHDSPSFEYQDKIFKILTIKIPDFIKTEYGYCYNLGENSSMSLDSIPIGAVERVAANPTQFMREEVYAGDNRIRLHRPSTVYLYADYASAERPETVAINGINKYGKNTIEEIVLNAGVPVETIEEYHIVSSISGNSQAITISNTIKEEMSFRDSSTLSKRISDNNGFYFTPFLALDENVLYVHDADSFARNDEYKFTLPVVPEVLLMSNLLDILYIYQNTLYSSKMFLDYTSLSQVNSSTNNNDMIWVDEETVTIGTNAILNVNSKLLKSEHSNASVRISIRNGDNISYITSSGVISSIKDSWISLSKTSDRISMSVAILNDMPYIFNLEVSTIPYSYHAMVYQNLLDFTAIEDNVSDMYIHNKKLYLIDTDGNTSTAKPIRLGFTTDDSYSYIQFPFQDMELIYDA